MKETLLERCQQRQLQDQSHLVYLVKNNRPFTDFRKYVLKECNAAIANTLKQAAGALEGIKKEPKECGVCNACELVMTCTTLEADREYNCALTDAQKILLGEERE